MIKEGALQREIKVEGVYQLCLVRYTYNTESDKVEITSIQDGNTDVSCMVDQIQRVWLKRRIRREIIFRDFGRLAGGEQPITKRMAI